jgi:hypothetical protein
MRDWNLAPGDPLALTIAADFRFCTPDYVNDHIWELEIGGGDPPALALYTTYGLRARTMRIFPRFIVQGQVYLDPAVFSIPPCLRRFAPNFLQLEYSPLPGLQVTAEYWVPDSHAVAGRLSVVNQRVDPLSVLLELCGQLVPLEGGSLTPSSMQSVNVLAGRCADLAPVIFLTGGSQSGAGPYPALSLDLALASGGTRTLSWVQAALAYPQDSFELARHLAALPWEAEKIKIEMINAAQSIEIQTGDPDWDAAFALSQKTAFGLFMGSSAHLPSPSFVLARQPDHGFSPRHHGRDYPSLWSGQPPLESYYLASLLPGATDLAEGLVRNFLAVQRSDGFIDSHPGLAGQRSSWLAAPLLTALAWQTLQQTGNTAFLAEVFPKLLAFHLRWLATEHDRDGDGFPEWDHPLQAGLDDHPAFNFWHPWDLGADISAAESPALAALLCRDAHFLAEIAGIAMDEHQKHDLELDSGRYRAAVEACWNSKAVLHHYRDRDSHFAPKGWQLAIQRGEGKRVLKRKFKQPTRLLVQLRFMEASMPSPEVILRGRCGSLPCEEHLQRADFRRGDGIAVATSRQTFTALTGLEVRGVVKGDLITLCTMDFNIEDCSLFLPLWAGILDERHTRTLVNRTMFAVGRFGYPFGVPMCVGGETREDDLSQAVNLPWNHLIGEGLLASGLRLEAAQLTTRLMSAVIENLKRKRSFARAYNAVTGTGLGERNPVHGLAPLGLFLQTLGVQICSPRQVVFSGKNPYPWPVTVKYRGLVVTRQVEQTIVIFPDGQKFTLNDPTEAVVSAD